jgi:N-acetylglucosamine repressor
MFRKSDIKITKAHIRKYNEGLLLREIYGRSTISRVELAELTNLSRPTVTEVTQTLLQRGLVIEVGREEQNHKVGKKATLLQFSEDNNQLVSVAIGDTRIVASLMNLRAQIQHQVTVSRSGIRSQQLLDLLISSIEEMVSKATRPLLGIAVGTPGIINSETGLIHLATSLGWENLPLEGLLSQRFNVPVLIGNDSNLAVIGEHWFGIAQESNDVVLVKIGYGVGVGILSRGYIIRGSTQSAGELGHNAFLPSQEVCLCGRKGCLETLVSWWGLIRLCTRIAAEHPDTVLNTLAPNGDITPAVITAAVQRGDPYVTQPVESAANYLGQALTFVVHLLNPRLIILTGSMVELGDVFIETLKRKIYELSFPVLTEQLDIRVSGDDERAIMLGACALLLERELDI